MPEPVTVEIEKLVYGGEGLARVDGQVLLAPYVLPGEQVVITPQRVKTGLLRGVNPEIIGAASERITPRCEYFASCGGCHYQHTNYGFELEQKRLILRETLQRLGGIDYENEIYIVSADPWYYRNRIQLHFSNRQTGFRRADSHDLCAITHCEISSPILNEVIAKLQWAVKQPQWPEFLQSLEVFTNETDVQLNIVDSMRPVAARLFTWAKTFLPSLASGAIDYRSAGHTFRVSRGSFFQVNRFLIDALVKEVVGQAEGSHAVDLHAGVGLFSAALSESSDRVDAVERSTPAFRDLQFNCKNVHPVNASAEEFLRTLSDAPDLVVADPPRAGLGREATDELLRLRPKRLTLVSCDPATLARDVRKLLASYQIKRLTLIDLFPQTYHFETVMHLEATASTPSISE